MSCNEWEYGDITIPAKAWANFRKGLLTKWNERQIRLLDEAKRAHQAATRAAKGKRGKGRQQAILTAVAQACGGTYNHDWGQFEARSRGVWGGGRDDQQHNKWESISHLILKREGYGRDAKVTLQAPKRKDLALVPVSKGGTISLPDANVSFDNKSRTVTWDVPENNHSVDRAKEHWFAKALFQALGRITWTRGSGGTIHGNNEYNEPDHGGYGRGPDYAVATYRPETAADRRRKAARRSSSSYGYARW
jgi:hypothetical protein